MKGLLSRRQWMSIAGLLLAAASPLAAAEIDSRVEVAAGLKQFKARNFEQARAAFAAAAQTAPADLRIAFDRACALAALGKRDEASELFREAALAEDLTLAADAHYNLGAIAAAQARTLWGGDAMQAAPDARQPGLAHLEAAAAHYRDCLALKSDHAEARHNLELIRLFTRAVQQAWDQTDRRQRREQLGLLQYLEMLTREQRQLRSTTRAAADARRSPRRWQAIYDAARAQQQLIQEIEPLKEKLAADAPGAMAVHRLADEAAEAMQQAQAQLGRQTPQPALAAQSRALEPLQQIFLAIAPFPELVQKGIEVEEQLVAESQRAASDEDAPLAEFGALAARQRFVSEIARLLPLKARALLQQLDPPPDEAAPPEPSEGEPLTAPSPVPPEIRPEQASGMKGAARTAIALAPEIEQLTRQAAGDLSIADAVSALPKQEEALRLLKEIAETLPPDSQPKPQQDSEQQQDQQQDQPQDSQNQQSPDQDQPQPGEQPGEEESKQPESDEGQPSDEQASQEQEPQSQQAPSEQDRAEQPPQDDQPRFGQTDQLTAEQTTALLQQVRERQRVHRARMQALERALHRGDRVEKDW